MLITYNCITSINAFLKNRLILQPNHQEKESPGLPDYECHLYVHFCHYFNKSPAIALNSFRAILPFKALRKPMGSFTNMIISHTHKTVSDFMGVWGC